MQKDDIKLFAKNKKELETLINTISIYSLGMEFVIEKYATLFMRSRKNKRRKE